MAEDSMHASRAVNFEFGSAWFAVKIRFEDLFNPRFSDSFSWQIVLFKETIFLPLRHGTDVTNNVRTDFVLWVYRDS